MRLQRALTVTNTAVLSFMAGLLIAGVWAVSANRADPQAVSPVGAQSGTQIVLQRACRTTGLPSHGDPLLAAERRERALLHRVEQATGDDETRPAERQLVAAMRATVKDLNALDGRLLRLSRDSYHAVVANGSGSLIAQVNRDLAGSGQAARQLGVHTCAVFGGVRYHTSATHS
jgi:hypothetical protein